MVTVPDVNSSETGYPSIDEIRATILVERDEIEVRGKGKNCCCPGTAINESLAVLKFPAITTGNSFLWRHKTPDRMALSHLFCVRVERVAVG